MVNSNISIELMYVFNSPIIYNIYCFSHSNSFMNVILFEDYRNFSLYLPLELSYYLKLNCPLVPSE